MSTEVLSQILQGHPEPPASDDPDPAAKPSRRAQNDQKWNSLKGEIYHKYMTQDSTLQETKRTFEIEHGFIARYAGILVSQSLGPRLISSEVTENGRRN